MVNVTRVTYLDPNKWSGVTNGWSRSRNMVAFGKNKTVEGEFLCALLRVTKGLVVVTRLGATWKAGLATVCQESGYLNLPGGSCGREASVCSPAVTRRAQPRPRQLCHCQPRRSLQSWVAPQCWHVRFELLEKKRSKTPHCNVELGKDRRCPIWKKSQSLYIRCFRTFWKLWWGRTIFFF